MVTTNKSTRDIAKEAVEDEVKRAGRGKRNRNIDSSDDDEDNVTNQKNGQKTSKRSWDVNIKVKSNEQSELHRLAGKYRDRVKERQDGIRDDDDNADVFLTDRSMGDEIFDNVVAAVESGDRQKLKSITTSGMIPTVAGRIPVTPKDALKWISNNQNIANTVFGTDILAYLRKTYLKHSSEPIQVSAAGRTLQKTFITFSQGINVDPQNRQRSWERPSEQTFATSEVHDNDSTDFIIQKASVICNVDVLQKIQKCFDDRDRRMQRTETHSKESGRINSIEASSAINENPDNSEDDDIFTSVGEYNPDNDDGNERTFPLKKPEGIEPNVGPIFEDKPTMITTKRVSQMDRSFVEPSVSQSLKGLSSLYPGGFGDDDGIGLDFGGPNYDDDDDDDDNETNNKEKKLIRKRGNKK